VPEASTATRRDWSFDADGKLDGMYVETRQVTVKNGPSAGKSKVVFDFHVGADDELVSVWETTVIRSKFLAELKARGADDFEPGERITIDPSGWKESPNGKYRNFGIEFEYGAPKKSAAALLDAGGGANPEPSPSGPGSDSYLPPDALAEGRPAFDSDY
jgi:hypothetical protein